MRRLIALAALAAGFHSPAAAQSCALIRAAQLPLTLAHNHLEVTLNINDQPATLIVDSGASITALTKDASYRLALRRDTDHSAEIFGAGATDTHLDLGIIDRLDLGGAQFTGVAAVIADLDALDRQDDGLLGADILSHFEAEFDIPHRLLTLWRAGNCASPAPDWAASAQIVEARITPSHQVLVPVTVEQSHLTLMLDTGAAIFTLNTRAAAQAAGEAALQSQQGTATGVNNQSFSASFYRFQSVKFAASTTQNVIGEIINHRRNDDYDGLLGLTPLLETRHFWISYATARVYFAP